MPDYNAATYGDRIARQYDDFAFFSEQHTQAAVESLAELAKGGPVLELGIGTGRIALPLSQNGLEVQGIDTSTQMSKELRKKPGGDAIPVTIGDFADLAVEGKFSLIYVVFNTFFALLTQQDQLRCFRNIAAHLQPEGLFVMEAFVPDLCRFNNDQNVVASRVGVDEVRLDVSQHDPVEQRVTAQHIVIKNGNIQLYPVQLRYAWPSELDLMAQLAGLLLKERWGNWQRSLFSSSHTSHISIYQLAAG